jgi:hypothetical protein
MVTAHTDATNEPSVLFDAALIPKVSHYVVLYRIVVQVGGSYVQAYAPEAGAAGGPWFTFWTARVGVADAAHQP